MTIRGSIDLIGIKGASGWIYNTADPRPMVIEAVLHHRVVGEALADIFRNDLADVGIGDGRCGFTLEFPVPIDPAYLPFVVVRPAGGDVELPRTSLSGFSEYLSSLYSSLPTAGRQKSVYGGLWTDRTDALAIVEGRKSIGTMGGRVAASIERMIVHGHVVLDLPPIGRSSDFESSGYSWIEQQVADVFFQPFVDELLKAIFDDRPVVTHGRILTDHQSSFRQGCTGHSLSSPLECVTLVSSCGPGPISLEFVRDSHNFPDFTRSGNARWLLQQDDIALRHAAAIGSAVEIVALDRGQIALIAAGTVYRCVDPSADGAIEALCVPARQLPLRTHATSPARKMKEFSGEIFLVETTLA